MRTVTIATRKSRLALWQANHVRAQLLASHRDLAVTLLALVSEGDKTLDTPLSVVGGKGLFLKELEQALLCGEADLAVHSMKDVTAALPDGLEIAAICQREDARDAFVSNHFDSLAQLMEQRPGAVVGTGSLRRQCQLRARYPRLQFANLRGNVNTRLERLDHDEFDGLVLAAAGLLRLQLQHRIRDYLAPEHCLPAAGQGAIGIECRSDDADLRALLRPLDDRDSAICVSAERAANAHLGGGCQVPLAVYAVLKQEQITVRALVGTVDGAKLLRSQQSGARADAIILGRAVAEDLLAQGAGDILDSVYAK